MCTLHSCAHRRGVFPLNLSGVPHTEHKQLHPLIYVFSYHTVDVHAGLQQGLDGAVVAVPCSQVKRGVPATLAGHEVGVGVDQHAHHLHTKGSRGDASLARPLRFRTCQSSVRRRGAAERSGRTRLGSTGALLSCESLPVCSC